MDPEPEPDVRPCKRHSPLQLTLTTTYRVQTPRRSLI